MTDYRRYCSVAGITNRDMVDALREKYPKYGKPTQSMICDPEGYAVQLLPEAEELLISRFGSAPGLSKKPPRNHANKHKPLRLYVRINAVLKERLESVKTRLHFATDQDMIEAALWQFCDKYADPSLRLSLRSNPFQVAQPNVPPFCHCVPVTDVTGAAIRPQEEKGGAK